ncbi:winged helix-turn-helix domain-containing protein [Gimesia aquarii]|uniref:Winged helix-turn-helix domain-containing protein n=1 Tax=Gimesia aquarii TaxID=2527964 RepID=A0A517X0Q8_9PLAN|nr:winged helix-turn-helix domain-containing protein [Gimesia aquarii]QDU11097.1 hypothetical protein V202x_45130 [Gimesia aquarii]
MSVEIESHEVESIGVVAGVVWEYLSENEPVTLSKLSREIDAPRDLVMQAVGWLGREGKIQFHKGTRSKLISLVNE